MVGLEIQTRFMSNKDFDRVIEIDYTSSGDYGLGPDELFEQWKKHPNGVGIVAVDADDLPVGYCIYNLEDKDVFELKHLVVDKSFQRLGVATSIIKRMKSKLNERRNILGCNVCEDNLAFHLFLKKMGFKAYLIRSSNIDIFRFEYKD